MTDTKMRAFPYAKLARAFGPRPTHTIAALGHRFIPYGEVEMLCRPCGFVIWKAVDAAAATAAVTQLGGGPCPAIATAPETPQGDSTK